MLRHESYKPTKIEWASEIPVDWDLQPIRALFNERKERNDGPKTDFILSVMKDVGVIPYDEKGNVGNKKSENIENYKVVYPGDLVVNKMNAIIGSLGISRYHGALSQVYFVLYPKDHARNNHKYLGYLFKVKPFQKSLIKIAKGMMELRESIEFDEFKKIVLPVPPREEQDRIVALLEQKISEVDSAIAKKEKFIALLQEQKAIMTSAMVFGLTSSSCGPCMAIPWVEQLPTHWKVKRAKYLFRQSRLAVKPSYEVVTAYRDGEVTLRSNRRIDGYTFAILEQGYQGVLPGQLVINSMDAFAGAIGVSDSEGKCSPEYVVCDAINCDEISPGFAALVLRQMALSGYIEVICSAVRQRALRIRYNDLAPLLLPVPPINEQLAIEKSVSEMHKHHNKLILNLRREISELKELSSILISNVTTGQIKV